MKTNLGFLIGPVGFSEIRHWEEIRDRNTQTVKKKIVYFFADPEVRKMIS